MVQNRTRAARLSEDCDLRLVAAEAVDVVLDPLQGLALVEQAGV